MGQQKIKLELIKDKRKRKTTFRVRQKGIIKKVSELSILCDINACAVIYSPYEVEPIVWPSPSGVQQVMSRYNNMSEINQNNRSLNHASFLRKMIVKVDGQMKRTQNQNEKSDLTRMVIEGIQIGEEMLETFSPSQLDDLGIKVEGLLEKVNKRIEIPTTQHHDDDDDDAFFTDIPPANSSISEQVESLPPIPELLPEEQISMAPQEVAPFSPPTFTQQELGDNNQPQEFDYWFDESLDYLIFDQGWNNQAKDL